MSNSTNLRNFFLPRTTLLQSYLNLEISLSTHFFVGCIAAAVFGNHNFRLLYAYSPVKLRLTVYVFYLLLVNCMVYIIELPIHSLSLIFITNCSFSQYRYELTYFGSTIKIFCCALDVFPLSYNLFAKLSHSLFVSLFIVSYNLEAVFWTTIYGDVNKSAQHVDSTTHVM